MDLIHRRLGFAPRARRERSADIRCDLGQASNAARGAKDCGLAVAMKMARRPRCSSVTDHCGYAPFSCLASRKKSGVT